MPTDTTPPGRVLLEGQRCRVRIWNRADRSVTTVHESTERLYEAPNWTSDGRLVLNADGVLWTMPADGASAPERVAIEGVPPLNNDHVLDPDGVTVHVSAEDFHIWSAPLAGGPATRVTPDDGAMHFLHGVSPDGTELAYVRLDPDGDDVWSSGTIHVLAVDGTADRAVTTAPGPADGPEWTPDGAWILFNTAQFEEAPGHAQIARVRPDGTELEQLTVDEHVNWFPHPTPKGDAAVFLSFPPGTQGHPADERVRLRQVTGPGTVSDWGPAVWQAAETIVELDGGQGTLNVNGWAPDGSAFAFVDYPIGAPAR
ncbi:PD40 domain-containing protein [Curtobacterium sp. PhB136]|uniref:TolB family protein n=1 Tax=Curtobacterium sp. PhB136 TaxID=2485181 RepID=UPI00104B1F87|nr:PD40 domain-containing protein [Curtobacterium sp. PhB136]TCK59281.1 WD40 repeat protein [Curtobacterium sp. PhB136]